MTPSSSSEGRKKLHRIAKYILTLGLRELCQEWDDEWLMLAAQVPETERNRPDTLWERWAGRSQFTLWDLMLIRTSYDLVEGIRKTDLYATNK